MPKTKKENKVCSGCKKYGIRRGCYSGCDMERIKLCEKHYTGTPYQVKVFDETRCKFCLSELRERMKKFGIVDWKQVVEDDKEKYL